MCGRARLSSDVSEIKVAFRIPPERPTPNIAPSWNVAPTDPARVHAGAAQKDAVISQRKPLQHPLNIVIALGRLLSFLRTADRIGHQE
jgi:hypothetical protein